MGKKRALPRFELETKFDVPRLKAEASAITFNPVDGHLYVVADEPAAIVAFTTDGKFVRKIKLKGFEDTEGLCHLRDCQFAVAEERKMRVSVIDVSQGGKSAERVGKPLDLKKEITAKGNKGLEGVVYAAGTDTLYVGREGGPPAIFAVSSFLGKRRSKVEEVSLDLSMLADLSDIYFDPAGPWLWALSHESKASVIYDLRGGRLARWISAKAVWD